MNNNKQIYVYFNESGELVSKTPYVENGPVRQGGDFSLNILFNKNTNLIHKDDMISIAFKCPGETTPNLFPFLSYYDTDKNIKPNIEFYKNEINAVFEKPLTKYGIEAGEYLCWTFNSSEAYGTSLPILTERDGNLEVQVTIFNGSPEKNTTSVNELGTFKIFIEKTMNYDSPFDVSQLDLKRFVEEVQEIAKTRTFGVHTFEVDFTTGDLVLYAERSDDLAEGNYEIDKSGNLVITVYQEKK